MPAEATTVTVLCSTAMKAVLAELAPQLQAPADAPVTVAYATSGGIAKRIAGGEAPDLVIAAATEMAKLFQPDQAAAGGIAIARSRIGVGVRKGAPKPDISTPAALKRALVAARRVAYTDPAVGGASGAYFAGVLAQLGIADQIEHKLAAGGPDGLVGTLVVNNQADIGIQQIPELIAAGLDLVGPLPADLQKPTIYMAVVPANARHAEAGKALLAVLTSPAALAVIAAEGMEAG